MRWMLYTLFGLMAADGILTKYLVTSGLAMEANPFLQSWVSHELFLTIKISGAFLATLFLWIKYTKEPRPTYLITLVFLIIYTVIIYWNLAVFIFPILWWKAS